MVAAGIPFACIVRGIPGRIGYSQRGAAGILAGNRPIGNRRGRRPGNRIKPPAVCPNEDCPVRRNDRGKSFPAQT